MNPSSKLHASPEALARRWTQRAWRLTWLAVLTAHAAVAAGWWWMMPGGFPVGHPRLWVNRVLPVIVVIVAIAARWASSSSSSSSYLRERRLALAAVLLAMFPAGWLAGAVAARAVFPISFRWLWIAPLLAALALVALLWPLRRVLLANWRWVVPSAAIAAAVAAFATRVQRGGDPRTHPSNVAIAPLARAASLPPDMRSIRLTPWLGVEPAAAVVNVQVGRVFIGLQPVLTFISRSPDRGWILFAHRNDRIGPLRRLIDLRKQQGSSAIDLRYRDDGQSMLRVLAAAGNNETTAEIEAISELPAAIYSHLNTFCELTIAGHRKLEISFSPCPDQHIAVTYGEYPRGLPRRCAYLSTGGMFRVVEASSGEKGPFTTLAEGPLRQDQPVTMTLYDQGAAFCSITLEDFASQADTSLSPTAGWGLPCNAIEFSLQGESPRSAAGVFISLSGTSVGRGYDTVGHAAGAYRNRMKIKIIDSAR